LRHQCTLHYSLKLVQFLWKGGVGVVHRSPLCSWSVICSISERISPMRFILVFFSAALAGYLAWHATSSANKVHLDIGDDVMIEDNAFQNENQDLNLVKLIMVHICQNAEQYTSLLLYPYSGISPTEE
ncbi:hypothetical protein Leryth_002895, partial [Lithospermum erythrorhizon]